ncbi:BadF/BadG/BcrA/BcrD ATPase family protein [Paenibacillus sp. RC67]|uniref:N-acetylglucosamine kinase n=1 Tax=Paenibacillus sp. RC67 TaxID=3039392 RepID=UPI0024AE38EF|nr:BadF/BadG/BcrA/BcrD ATPase family protein [Paenibacillus sp. RC67]
MEEQASEELRNQRYIGIDGGGTKTACMIGDGCGRILTACYGESSSIKSRPWDEVKRVLKELIEQAMELSQSEESQLAGVFLGLAGADRPEERKRLYSFMRELLADQVAITIHNDAITALAAGTWGEAGIVLISGTGSIAYGYLPETDTYVRVGGWGYLLGDEGSGYDIGRQALIAVMKEHDGRGRRTQLTERLLDYWSLPDPNQIISYVYSQSNVRTVIADVAKWTLMTAEQGDEIAEKIVQAAIADLAELAVTVKQRLAVLQPAADVSHLPLVLSGGLFSNDWFMERLSADKAIAASGLSLRRLSIPPAAGCYMLALKQAGIQITDTIKQHIADWETGGEA